MSCEDCKSKDTCESKGEGCKEESLNYHLDMEKLKIL